MTGIQASALNNRTAPRFRRRATQLEPLKFSFYFAARVRRNSSGSGFCFAPPIGDSHVVGGLLER
jgi:hypothetical protein